MIRYSGYPILYQEFLADVGTAYGNFVAMLQSAGWDYIRDSVPSGASQGCVLQCRRTPQGLQCRLAIWQQSSGDHLVFFRFMSVDEVHYNELPMIFAPRTNSFIRIIANPYQFFTFKYNNLREQANCVMGGVPWIPSFLEPYKIVSVSPGPPVIVNLNRAHDYIGELVTIDGEVGTSGLNGTWNASRTSPASLRLNNCSYTGNYLTNSAVLAGPDRLARLIWSQSNGYANGWLFNDPSNCFRYHLNAAPAGPYAIGNDYSNNNAMVNQYSWVISDEFGQGNSEAAVRVFPSVPFGLKWYNGSFIAREPFLSMGEVTRSSESRVVGQLWDAFVTNKNFGQLDKTISFNSRSWFVYTSTLHPSLSNPDGALCLRISEEAL
jgi:hypothetical protein